jgi:glycosyltransferase involved in cell wall biosynthesis
MPDPDGRQSDAPSDGRSVALGVMAYNAADHIEMMLVGLSRQSLFERADIDARLHVVANGCTDDTADRVRTLLATPEVSTRIRCATLHEVARKGKANAWNVFVHEFVDPTTDYLMFVDSDIAFESDDVCEQVVERLVERPEIAVAIDEVVSDLSLEEQPRFIEKIVLAATSTEHDPEVSITGQFYCARREVVQAIVMPTEIIGEDGFLRAMVLTRNFTADEDLSRLSLVRGARHVYKSERSLRSIYHHQVRQTLGTITNIVLFGHLRSVLDEETDLASHVRRMNAADPAWLPRLVAGNWPHRVGAGTRRRLLLRRFGTGKLRPIQFPFRLAITVVDLITYSSAIRKIRSGRAVGYW